MSSMSTDLQIDVSEQQGSVPVTVLRLEGPLDASTHTALENKVAQLVEQGTRNLIMDLSRVSYMGSAGFFAIQTIIKLLRSDAESERGGAVEEVSHVKLLAPSDEVMKVIRRLGVENYLDIRTDLGAAVASF